MPLNFADFLIGSAIVIGLPVAVILMNRWRPGTGWWLIAAVVVFVVVGNLIERLATITTQGSRF